MPEEDELKSEEPEPQQILTREELMARFQQERPVEIVEGCRVRGLSAADYQRLQAMRAEVATKAKSEDRERDFRIGTQAGWLSLGVQEPQLTYEEWRTALEEADSGMIMRMVEAIQRLSGQSDLEVELARKVLDAIAR